MAGFKVVSTFVLVVVCISGAAALTCSECVDGEIESDNEQYNGMSVSDLFSDMSSGIYSCDNPGVTTCNGKCLVGDIGVSMDIPETEYSLKMHIIMQGCVTEEEIKADYWDDECYPASDSIFQDDDLIDFGKADGSYCLCSADDCNEDGVEELGGDTGSLGGDAGKNAVVVSLLGICALLSYVMA